MSLRTPTGKSIALLGRTLAACAFVPLAWLMWLVPGTASAQVLENLVATALLSHPSAAGQRALVASAQAGLESAHWQLYPTPSATVESASSSANDPSYRGNPQVATFRLQQPLWTGGRLTAGIDKAQAGVGVSEASYQEVRQQLALKVLQAYSEWLSAHLKKQANEASQATHLRLREQVQRRISEGVSAQSDLVLAQSRLDAITADVVASVAQRDVALSRLGQLVGQAVQAKALEAAIARPRNLALSPQALLEQALALSPSVQKAKYQAQAQLAVAQERSADLQPEFYARLEQQYGSFSYSSAAPETRLFVGVTSRLGAGLSSASNAQAARTQYEAALAEIEVQSRLVADQVSADKALAASASSRMSSVIASLGSAKELSESYDRQFLAGRKSWLDVMNAARELAQTETLLADLLSTQVIVTWRLDLSARGLDALTQTAP
jgi:adhesin transport system outer membrane protein